MTQQQARAEFDTGQSSSLSLDERITELNNAMLREADQDNWERVADYVNERAQLLAQLTGTGHRPILQATEQTTRQVLAIARRARNAVGEKISALHRGQRAVDSYNCD
jgi:hypothetical protein